MTRGHVIVTDREKLIQAALGSYGAPEALYDDLLGPITQSRESAPSRAQCALLDSDTRSTA